MKDLFVVRADVANPDIAKAHRVAVVLQVDLSLRRVRRVIIADSSMRGVSQEFSFVMQEHTVMNDRYAGFLHQGIAVPAR